MNYLAHIYLSGDNPKIKVGNFMADAIKGKKYLDYDKEIRKGIKIHRFIDSYTDSHELVKKCTQKLHSDFGHYSGIIIDIFFDHFLAKNWKNYSLIPLGIYTQEFYSLLHEYKSILPKKVKYFVPYMVTDDWLYHYQFLEGIAKTLEGMNRRTKNKSQMHKAIENLKNDYLFFQYNFELFFEQLQSQTQNQLQL